MLTLHYYPSNASFAPHVVLHELGVPFHLELVDRQQQAHKSPQYLKLNPNGLIPVLTDGALVLYESAAISLHLADTHAAAGLAPPFGSTERAHLYKWLFWLSDTLQPALVTYFYPERTAADAADAKARAERRVVELLAQVDAQLAAHGGPWLLADGYSIADAHCFMLCRWTRGFEGRKARDFAHIGPYLKRVFERPAVQRAVETERLQAPHY